MQGSDIIVIGAGIAGASAGYELAARSRVVLLEREAQPGYHSTGRSAAQYIQTYGNPTMCALAVGAWPFFDAPPQGFAEQPLLSPRGLLYLARADQMAQLDSALAEARAQNASVEALDAKAALRMVPVLRDAEIGGALYAPDTMDMDVNALHQGYLRGLRDRGGRVIVNAEVRGLQHGPGGWLIETRAGNFTAPVVVNAAGAWCDEIARMAGLRAIGLSPKRRTIIVFDAPPGFACRDWPLFAGIAEDYYVKPDAGRLIGSPADETPVPPCDVQPEDLDVALAVERIQSATQLQIRRIINKWAGLRSFVADKTLVAGFDPGAEGFFWLAAQGGYGIQTAPSTARVAAALIGGEPIPADLAELGVEESALSPRRLL